MAELLHVRVDERLIHGVVMATWVPSLGVNKIVAVDDETAADDFISMIMKSCTNGIPAEIYSLEQAAGEWKKDKFGEKKTLLLFKRVSDALKAYELGISYPVLQLGWLNPGNDRIRITTKMCLTKNEIEALKDFESRNQVKIELQYSPDEVPLNLNKAIEGKIK